MLTRKDVFLQLFREDSKFILLNYWRIIEGDFEKIADIMLEEYGKWVKESKVRNFTFVVSFSIFYIFLLSSNFYLYTSLPEKPIFALTSLGKGKHFPRPKFYWGYYSNQA